MEIERRREEDSTKQKRNSRDMINILKRSRTSLFGFVCLPRTNSIDQFLIVTLSPVSYNRERDAYTYI